MVSLVHHGPWTWTLELLISRYAVSAMFMATNILPFWLTTGPMQLAECDKLDQEALAEAHPVDDELKHQNMGLFQLDIVYKRWLADIWSLYDMKNGIRLSNWII